ncbi:uncharacterized protein LOC124949933 isoform X2 [Vespa velutina]|nr:uncharacterized protein LOC124949933 isoform X2 [Vespa velutina]
MKFDELMSNTNDCQVQQEGNIFEESDKVDGSISVRIISRPETETQYIVDDLLLNLIRQITSYILETSQKQQEELESEKKEVSLCRRTKKACSLYSDCLKPRSITTTDEEYSEVQNRGVQFQKCLQQEPSIVDDDSFSIQSYEYVRTMDVGCECKVERKHDELDGTNNRSLDRQEELDYEDHSNISFDSFLNILTKLITRNETTDYLENINITEPIYSIKPKCGDLCEDPTSSMSSKKDKCIDCTCEFDSQVMSPNKIEIINEQSYSVENFESMSMEIGSKKDVGTSTYSISVFSQITSTLQIKSTKSQKLSCSTQCDIGPECKWSFNTGSQATSVSDTQKRIKKRDHSNSEEFCPCKCGYFLEGESTCSCECIRYSNSPCIAPSDLKKVKKKTKRTISPTSDLKIPDQKSSGSNKPTKSEKSNYEINCQFCSCNEYSSVNIPIDPIVKRMNNIIDGQDTISDSQGKCESNCKHSKDDKQLDLEEEARKLQQKIESYKKENEYYRELIQACSSCQKNTEILSCPPPIRATYSGLATAIEILQSKCRSKDSMIAILAEGLRGVVNYAQIAKNLAAPCLEYTYWDFDRSALYTYLRKTMSKLSVEKRINSTLSSNETVKEHDKAFLDSSCDDTVPPSPTDFKVVQEFCKCLLLSWKIPENLENVAGYRIYVNG